MATRRVRKKKAQREEIALREVVGQATSIREVRVREVCVACPACSHPVMERRYLPMLGGASGSARCPSCSVELAYERVLAHAMGESIGLVPAPPAARMAPIAPPTTSPFQALLATLRQALRPRRSWSFASV